jgi:hypothetical protein
LAGGLLWWYTQTLSPGTQGKIVTDSPIPEWVRKRDGRLMPFEPDKLCRSLFAATESLGLPDPFLARELTDGVLHFLGPDCPAIPSTIDLHDLVIKVVRELGHPALAQQFADHADQKRQRPTAGSVPVLPGNPWPMRTAHDKPDWAHDLDDVIATGLADGDPPEELLRQIASVSLRSYSLRRAVPPELAAAHRDGLLTLTGLEAPLELAGLVLPPPPAGSTWTQSLLDARACAGQFVAIDGLEHALDADGPNRVLDQLREGMRLTGLAVVVNLNSSPPPIWARDRWGGPLFAGLPATTSAAPIDRCDELLQSLLASPHPGWQVAWHLSAADLAPEGERRLLTVLRFALAGASLELVFDRPRRPVSLAEGLDRDRPGVLTVVGLGLTRLADQSATGSDLDAYLTKLESLARLARAAGRAKLDYLRKHARPVAHRAFLLERARLVIVPVGLDALVRRLTGRAPTGEGLVFARRTLDRLRQTLAHDRPRVPESCLDGPPPGCGLFLEGPGSRTAGPTAWDALAPLRQQVKAAGELQSAAGAGTAALLLPPDRRVTVQEAADLVRLAWQTSGVSRLRFVAAAAGKQLTAAWGA